ncbi:hypothetical protein MC885_007909, partial [Smutsia gigantea]
MGGRRAGHPDVRAALARSAPCRRPRGFGGRAPRERPLVSLGPAPSALEPIPTAHPTLGQGPGRHRVCQGDQLPTRPRQKSTRLGNSFRHGPQIRSSWIQLREKRPRFQKKRYQAPKPDIISNLEEGEEPWLGKGKRPRQGCPSEVASPKQTGANGKEVQQDEDQLKNQQESQNKLLREVVLKKKTLTKKKGHECSLLGKKDVSTKHVPSKKKLLKVDSHGKSLKQNLDLPGHIRNCAKKKPGVAKEHRKSFSHNSSDMKKDKNQTRKKHKKLSNHSSPNKCDKIQTGKKHDNL